MVVAVPPASCLGLRWSKRAAQQKRYERANNDFHRVGSLFGGAHLLGLHDVLRFRPGLVDNAGERALVGKANAATKAVEVKMRGKVIVPSSVVESWLKKRLPKGRGIAILWTDQNLAAARLTKGQSIPGNVQLGDVFQDPGEEIWWRVGETRRLPSGRQWSR
jgi:hypothetical protein